MEQSQKICGKISIDEGPSLFSIIMPLKFFIKITTNTKSCYDYAATIMKDENTKQTITSYMDKDIFTTVTNTENNENRKLQILPLLFGIGAVASAILSAGTAIYTSEQLIQIKRPLTKIDTHPASFTDTINEQRDKLVTIIKATDSLYEYINKHFRI